MSTSDTLLIYGINPVTKVLNNRPSDVDEIYFLGKDLNPGQKIIFNLAKNHLVKVLFIDQNETDLLLKEINSKAKVVHQKVFAHIKNKTILKFDEFISKENLNFCVILDGVTDANNLGAIIRNLSAFGVDLLILPKDRSAQIDGVVYKTSAGEIEEINTVVVSNLNNAVKKLKASGFWIYGFEEDGADNLWDTDFSGKVACVLGGEGTGIRRLLKESCDFLIKIPMSKKVQSLNVSSACSIVCYEVFKSKSTKVK